MIRRRRERSELKSIETGKKKLKKKILHRNRSSQEAKGGFNRRVYRFFPSFSPTMAEHLASLFGTEKDRVNVR